MGLPYAALGGDGVFGCVVGIYGGRDVVVVATAEDVAAVFQFYHAHGGLCIFFLHVIYFFEVIEVIASLEFIDITLLLELRSSSLTFDKA